MMFLVVERFRDGNPHPVRERFVTRGRLLPDGVTYRDSWIDEHGARCFQVMEAADRDALQRWIDRWSDLIEFDVIPVVAPADYWARIAS